MPTRRLRAADVVAAGDRDLQVRPQPAAGRLDDRLLAAPQAGEPVCPGAFVGAGRDEGRLGGRIEPGGHRDHVQAGREALDVDPHRAADGDRHRDQIRRVRQAGGQPRPWGRERGLAVRAAIPAQRRGLLLQLAGRQDPERAVRDRVLLPVALAQECRRPGALAVVEHPEAAGRRLRRQVHRNDPDPDDRRARGVGHARMSAIRAASRRTPSSIWSVASALHDSRIAWPPPPPV
jgi:hypothetical protein